MNRLITLISFLLISALGFSQTFEIMNGDTINMRDANNKRQGVWIKFSAQQSVLEKGTYVNNKKEGVWTTYYPSGGKKNEITYVNNKANGPATIYYESGFVSEKGIWKVNKWVGEYKYFHKNGNVKYAWTHDESGKRTGEQKYYYNDGALMIKGDWTAGKKEGVLTEYYPDGSVKSEINFNDGKIEVESIKEYEVAEKPEKKQVAKRPSYQRVMSGGAPSGSSSGSKDYFTLTGYFKTYNEFKKLDREGDFIKGKLVDGKRYIYDDDGNLIKTITYKNGKVVSSADNKGVF